MERKQNKTKHKQNKERRKIKGVTVWSVRSCDESQTAKRHKGMRNNGNGAVPLNFANSNIYRIQHNSEAPSDSEENYAGGRSINSQIEEGSVSSPWNDIGPKIQLRVKQNNVFNCVRQLNVEQLFIIFLLLLFFLFCLSNAECSAIQYCCLLYFSVLPSFAL